MLRVLFLLGAGERGGGERVLLGLARNLPTLDVEPVIGFLADGPFAAEVAEAGVRAIRILPKMRARQIWRMPEIVREIAAGARDVKAGVLQANGEKMALYSGWAARRMGAASVFWLHDPPRRSRKSSMLQLGVALSPHDAAVVPSMWMAREFRRRLRMKVVTIPNGIELDCLPDGSEAPVSLDLPSESVVVGHFGRLQRWKGADLFLRAAGGIAAEIPQARFLVVGGPLYGWEQEYADGLPALAERLGLSDRVTFMGHREDSLSIMGACDIVVHSSVKAEPFGLVVVEGMALGKAVIASRSGGPDEIIDDGVSGVLVPRGDPAALGAAIARLVEDADERVRLGDAARTAAGDRFSASRMAEEFSFLYRRLLGTRAKNSETLEGGTRGGTV